MKKMFSFFLFMATVLAANGQSAKVIILEDDDAVKAKALYAQRDKVNQEIIDLQNKIRMRYLSKWNTQLFEFSEDFKYVVPSTVSPFTGSNCCGWILGGCLTTTPATTNTFGIANGILERK